MPGSPRTSIPNADGKSRVAEMKIDISICPPGGYSNGDRNENSR